MKEEGMYNARVQSETKQLSSNGLVLRVILIYDKTPVQKWRREREYYDVIVSQEGNCSISPKLGGEKKDLVESHCKERAEVVFPEVKKE